MHGNVKGVEFFDFESEELTMDLHNEEDLTDDGDCQVNEYVADATIGSSRTDNAQTQSAFPSKAVWIKEESEFFDRLYEIVTSQTTSKLFTPFVSQLKATCQKARRRRLESKASYTSANVALNT